MKRRSWKNFLHVFAGPKQLSTVLQGRDVGIPLKYGPMEVIPLLNATGPGGEYGIPSQTLAWESSPQLTLQNRGSLPAILPLHLAFVEHGLPGQAPTRSRLLHPEERIIIEDALSLNPSEARWHLLTEDRLIALPYMLREAAYAGENAGNPQLLWSSIQEVASVLQMPDMTLSPKHRVAWWNRMKDACTQLAVQEGQTGAVILLSGEVIGIELAPDTRFWQDWWPNLCQYTYAPLLLMPVFEREWTRTAGPAAMPAIGSLKRLQAEQAAIEAIQRQKAAHILAQITELPLQVALRQQLGSHKLYDLEAGPYAGQGLVHGEIPRYLSLFRQDRWQF